MSVAPSSAPKAHSGHHATPSHARKPKTKSRRHAVPSHARHPVTVQHPSSTHATGDVTRSIPLHTGSTKKTGGVISGTRMGGSLPGSSFKVPSQSQSQAKPIGTLAGKPVGTTHAGMDITRGGPLGANLPRKPGAPLKNVNALGHLGPHLVQGGRRSTLQAENIGKAASKVTPSDTSVNLPSQPHLIGSRAGQPLPSHMPKPTNGNTGNTVPIRQTAQTDPFSILPAGMSHRPPGTPAANIHDLSTMGPHGQETIAEINKNRIQGAPARISRIVDDNESSTNQTNAEGIPIQKATGQQTGVGVSPATISSHPTETAQTDPFSTQGQSVKATNGNTGNTLKITPSTDVLGQIGQALGRAGNRIVHGQNVFTGQPVFGSSGGGAIAIGEGIAPPVLAATNTNHRGGINHVPTTVNSLFQGENIVASWQDHAATLGRSPDNALYPGGPIPSKGKMPRQGTQLPHPLRNAMVPRLVMSRILGPNTDEGGGQSTTPPIATVDGRLVVEGTKQPTVNTKGLPPIGSTINIQHPSTQVTSPTSTHLNSKIPLTFSGHSDLQIDVPLPPASGNSQFSGVSSDTKVISFNQHLANPSSQVLYGFSAASPKTKTLAELNLVYGDGKNSFTAIDHGQFIHTFDNVPVIPGHTYRRTITFDHNSGAPSYYITDMNTGKHDSFTQNPIQRAFNDIASSTKRDLGPFDPTTATAFFESIKNPEGGANIFDPGRREPDSNITGPYNVQVSNFRRIDGDRATPINTTDPGSTSSVNLDYGWRNILGISGSPAQSNAAFSGDAFSNAQNSIDNMFAKFESKFGNIPGVSARLQQAQANVDNQLFLASTRLGKVKASRL